MELKIGEIYMVGSTLMICQKIESDTYFIATTLNGWSHAITMTPKSLIRCPVREISKTELATIVSNYRVTDTETYHNKKALTAILQRR